MAKSRRGRKKTYNKEGRADRFEEVLGLNQRLALEALAIILTVLGLLMAFSLVGIGGAAGAFVNRFFRLIFGSVAIIVPIAFIYLGLGLFRPESLGVKPAKLVGLLIVFIALPALLHFFHFQSGQLAAARAGVGGGLLGYLVSGQLIGLFGSAGSIVVLIGLTLIGGILIFQLSIRELLRIRDADEEEAPDQSQTDGGSRVSVFTTLKRTLSRLKPEPEQPEKTLSVESTGDLTPRLSSAVDWQFPPLDLLSRSDQVASSGNITRNVETIQKTLRNFGIMVTMQDVNIGPTVTQYTLKPVEGVKLNQITARANDLALALSAKSIRIEAPIPGKSVVGVEIPNKVTAPVTLREILESPEFRAVKSRLALGLGRDVAGLPFAVDLDSMPHLLIAGATGSGKSVAINGVILTLLFQNSPADLKLLLVDPKRVELTGYNGIPHLLTRVVTDPQQTISALKWTVHEMERRYKLFQESGHRNIAAYNKRPPNGRLAYIVVIIDELADLMAVAANDVEASIVRLAQLARATGIHLIVATQRPSVNVLTGLIKANITSRIAFAVASQVDSRTILDISGAEKLLGNGDMLFLSGEIGKPKRVQGVLTSDKEIEQVVDFIKENNLVAKYDETILEYKVARAGQGNDSSDFDDPLFDEAVDIVLQAGKGSASLLQRRLRIGYARAARLLDILEAENIIGPADGSKPREVMITSSERPFRSSRPGQGEGGFESEMADSASETGSRDESD